MKILIVSQYFWPENFRINDLAMALKERGHDVSVLTGMPNYPAGKAFDGYSWWRKRRDHMKSIPIIRSPLFLRRESKSWQLVLNYLSFAVSASVWGAWAFRKKEFDVIFTFEVSPITVAYPAMVMRKLKKVPMLFWVQDLWPESLSATGSIQSPAALSMVQRLVKNIYQHCDLIPVQSQAFIEPAMEVGAEREKIRYFPNWVESLFKPVSLEAGASERLEVPSDGFVVMFAGNLGEAQSIETMVGAAEILRNMPIHWIFLGDGRRREWLEASVVEKKLDRVHVLGSRPLETMPSYFSLADAMLVTLRDDPVMMATIPSKVQSYLACGRPVIGALNGEGARIIDDSGSGFCATSGDEVGLAEVVLKMSQLSPQKRQMMGDAGLAYYAEHFDRKMLIDKLESWMQELCIKS